MKKKSILIVLVVLVVLSLSGCSNTQSLIGKWEEQTGQTNTKGEAVFFAYEFFEDGSLKMYNGAGVKIGVKLPIING